MKIDVDHIRQLVIEEMTGTLSDADAAWLQQMRAESAEVWLLCTQLRKELDTPEIQEAVTSLEDTLPVEKVLANAKRNKRKRNIITSIASMAILLLMAAGLWTYLGHQPVQHGLAVNNHLAVPRGVQLQFSNGTIVDLSQEQKQVKVGNVTINNAQQKLTYAAANSTLAGWATLNVPPGKDYKIQLSDGSEVWLNSATRLTFPFTFSGQTREISINGEAYLKVSRHSQQPFVVHLPHSTVQVLGTAFNVNTYDSGHIKVALLEGSVKMLTTKRNVVLQPGYAIHYSDAAGMEVAPFDTAEVLSWQHGIYAFDDKPLEAVCDIIPRWYGIKVVIDNPQTARRHFTGYFDRNRPVQTALESLKATRLIDYYFDKDNILHIR